MIMALPKTLRQLGEAIEALEPAARIQFALVAHQAAGNRDVPAEARAIYAELHRLTRTTQETTIDSLVHFGSLLDVVGPDVRWALSHVAAWAQAGDPPRADVWAALKAVCDADG